MRVNLCERGYNTSEHFLFHMLKTIHSEEGCFFSAWWAQIAGYLFSAKATPLSVQGSFNAVAAVLHWRAGPSAMSAEQSLHTPEVAHSEC